jgi:hypothetical protein
MEKFISILFALVAVLVVYFFDSGPNREAHFAVALPFSLFIILGGFWAANAANKNGWEQRKRLRFVTLLSGWLACFGILATIAAVFLGIVSASVDPDGFGPFILGYSLASPLWVPALILELRARKRGA